MDEEINPLSHPWAQETLETIMETTRTNVLNWCGVVIKMGMDEDRRKQWTTSFKQQITNLYGDMMQDIVAHQNRLFVEIETLLQKSASLSNVLHIKEPGYGSRLNPLERKQLLQKRIKSYERLVEEKRAEVAVLNKQELEFCLALGRTPKTISESPLPTPEFIQEFQQYLETLETEKFTREEKFLDVKGQITEIVAELSYTPTLDFEKTVISPDDSLFLVTDENMMKLDNFYDSLKQLLDETKAETEAAHVKRLRAELVNLWDQCHCTDEERDFEVLHTDLYSEDLVTLLDTEIQKLKKYYNENRDLFNLLEEREEQWGKSQTLEQRATDPNRYNNRGGLLLKEEKERNALAKRIPEIEKQLLERARDFEKRTRKPFLSWGESVESIISRAEEKRDQEKKLKVMARKQQRAKSLTPEPSTSSKRKPVTDPLPAKRMRGGLAERDQNVPQIAGPKITVNGKSLGPSRYSIERAKRIEKCRRVSRKMMQKLEKENAAACSAEKENQNLDASLPVPTTSRETS